MPEVGPTSARDWIVEHYKDQIRSGTLGPGCELPGIRRLADQRNVSPSTAQRALTLLRDEGWIKTRPGKPPVVVGVPRDL